MTDAKSGSAETPSALLAAWAVHAFTTGGALWGLLALIAVARQQWGLAFAWMTLALVVDAFDGMLARWARVQEVTPGFDGALLDNMLDYLNYVVVPAFLIHEAGLLPERFAVAGAGAVCLVSGYQFCQSGAKTDDHYFKGFPSYWNVLAFYLFLGGLAARTNLIILVVFAGMVFVPLKWIYPSRMSRWRGITIAATCLWGAMCIAMLAQFPAPAPWLLYASLGYIAYYVLVSLYLTLAVRD